MKNKFNVYPAVGRSTRMLFKKVGDEIVGNHDGGFLHPTAPYTQWAQR